MLEAFDLTARRGSLLLFSRLRLRVEAGRGLLVTGRNGSGKTTLLRMLAGLAQPEDGRVTWNGESIAADHASMRAHRVYVGHAPALKDELTVEENLRSLAALAGANATDDAIAQSLAHVDLHDQRALPARVLSQGQRRRIGLARLVLLPRALWLLDEPATALDGAGLAWLGKLIAQRLREGGIVVAATHQAIELPIDRVDTLAME
jgi:heme exporter protein A